MADTAISGLLAAGALAGTEPLPIVQAGSTVKTTTQAIANLGKTLSAASLLIGRGAGAGGGAQQEITLGANLTMTGTVLSSAVSGDAQTANPLSQFAATTSAQLAGVMTDETGAGSLVFASAPTLVNPVVGTQAALNNSTLGASTAYVDAATAVAVAASLQSRRTVTAITPVAGVATIDISLGDYYTLAPTANVTSIVFTNLPGAGKGTSLMLRFTQDTTPRTVAFPASFKWVGGVAGTVSTGAGAVDAFGLTTFDNGTTWEVTIAKAFA